MEIRVFQLFTIDIGLVEGRLQVRVGCCIVHVVQMAVVFDLGVVVDGTDGEVVGTELSGVEDALQVAHLGGELDGSLAQLIQLTSTRQLVGVWICGRGCCCCCEIAFGFHEKK